MHGFGSMGHEEAFHAPTRAAPEAKRLPVRRCLPGLRPIHVTVSWRRSMKIDGAESPPLSVRW